MNTYNRIPYKLINKLKKKKNNNECNTLVKVVCERNIEKKKIQKNKMENAMIILSMKMRNISNGPMLL